MIHILMNQKRGLTDLVSCPTMEIPGRRITNSGAKETPVGHRWTNQQTRSTGANQLK